jgi:hypothetical protein
MLLTHVDDHLVSAVCLAGAHQQIADREIRRSAD